MYHFHMAFYMYIVRNHTHLQYSTSYTTIHIFRVCYSNLYNRRKKNKTQKKKYVWILERVHECECVRNIYWMHVRAIECAHARTHIAHIYYKHTQDTKRFELCAQSTRHREHVSMWIISACVYWHQPLVPVESTFGVGFVYYYYYSYVFESCPNDIRTPQDEWLSYASWCIVCRICVCACCMSIFSERETPPDIYMLVFLSN